MKQKFLFDSAKMALMRSKAFFCAAVLGLVASFQISIMSSPAHAIKQYSQANGNIACSSCHSRTGLANGTMYPLTSKGAYFKTNGILPPRAAPVPTAPPYNPQPQQPVYPQPQQPVYPPNVAPRPTANLAYPLQSELKRIGCLRGRVDGVWGRGSRAALRRFSRQARLRLGSEPSTGALNAARRSPAGYCQPVRQVYPNPTIVYPPPRVLATPPRTQSGNFTCAQAKRIIERQGYGLVKAKNCNGFGRYTFYGYQGGRRYRLRIRASDGVIYKRQEK